jgi:hypothetical protein
VNEQPDTWDVHNYLRERGFELGSMGYCRPAQTGEGIRRYTKTIVEGNGGIWYAHYKNAFVARSYSPLALFVYCELNNWEGVADTYDKAPLLGDKPCVTSTS